MVSYGGTRLRPPLHLPSRPRMRCCWTQTAGNLMWVAARSLGPAEEATVRDAAYGAGVAAWLHAIPQLVEQGRVPLLDGTDAGVVALAEKARARLRQARANRGKISKAARAAMYSLGAADKVLSAAMASPARVSAGELPPMNDFPLSWRAMSGRW